jgi:hypothetical protein
VNRTTSTNLSVFLLAFIGSSTSFAQEPQERVQFHLKKVETLIQKQETEARIRSLEHSDLNLKAETPKYVPNFGIGDEGIMVESEPHVCTASCDLPRVLSLQERIRLEATERGLSSNENQDYERAPSILG